MQISGRTVCLLRIKCRCVQLYYNLCNTCCEKSGWGSGCCEDNPRKKNSKCCNRPVEKKITPSFPLCFFGAFREWKHFSDPKREKIHCWSGMLSWMHQPLEYQHILLPNQAVMLKPCVLPHSLFLTMTFPSGSLLCVTSPSASHFPIINPVIVKQFKWMLGREVMAP